MVAITKEAMDLVLIEMGRGISEHGDVPINPDRCVCILTEEVVEVWRASRMNDVREMKSELAQVAAFALRWMMALEEVPS